MPIARVIDPKKKVTDPLILRMLDKQGIDKNYVEFSQDYAPRSKGKEHSPYAKFYRDLKSNKRFMVVSGLPMCKVMGHPIEIDWLYARGKYYSKANLFSAIVEGKQVQITCLSNQPDGTKKNDRVTYKPQLFLDGSEIVNGSEPKLLPVDPINADLKENTLEWNYGTVCKRRIRLIQGRFRERWLFKSNPHSKVRIKHNFAGRLKLRLGRAIDAEGNHLKISVIGDEEIVEASEFGKAVFPVEISAETTFYPDASVETSSVDGYAYHRDLGATWATIRGGAGTAASDTGANANVVKIESHSTLWDRIYRGLLLFDTSALPSDATAAVLSLYGTGKADNLSITPKLNIYASLPASNTAVVAGDYDSLGTTKFCDTDITYAAFSTSGYNDFTLNASGLAAIDKTGVSKFGARDVDYDAGNSEPGSGSGGDTWSTFQIYYADQGSNKPKLVVTYTAVTGIGASSLRSSPFGFNIIRAGGR